jgi:Protein of unknown function (DUF3014)
MTDYLDRDLDADFQTTRPYSSPPPRRSGGWVWIALLIVAIGGGFYYFVSQRRVPPKPVAVTPTPTQAPPRAAPPRALGGDAEPIELPPLDETDPIVREKVGALSNNPTVAAWLATSGLIRNVTRVVQAIAEDRGVARHLSVVRPAQPFSTLMSGGRMTIDPRSYRRYDAIAAAVSTLDPRATATLYSTFRPRISEAYAELGFPNTPFDATLEDALVTLVSTPVPDGPIEVTPRGGTYAFADPRLEALAPAQKQLLRMGPENARAMKAKLREIAIALGVPAERLPQ